MCTEIEIDGEEVSSTVELASVVGFENIVFCDGEERQPGENTCLCCVAVEKTAKHIGVKCERTPWGFKFERKESVK